LPQLREEGKQLQQKIFTMNLTAAKQKRDHEILEQKFESKEKELLKAREKIRRLEGKLNAGKMIDDSHGPE
jgi:hypothetical protein